MGHKNRQLLDWQFFRTSYEGSSVFTFPKEIIKSRELLYLY